MLCTDDSWEGHDLQIRQSRLRYVCQICQEKSITSLKNNLSNKPFPRKLHTLFVWVKVGFVFQNATLRMDCKKWVWTIWFWWFWNDKILCTSNSQMKHWYVRVGTQQGFSNPVSTLKCWTLCYNVNVELYSRHSFYYRTFKSYIVKKYYFLMAFFFLLNS